MNHLAPDCAVRSDTELHQPYGRDPESHFVVDAKPVGSGDALVSADEEDAAVVLLLHKTGFAVVVVVVSGCVIDSAASVRLVDESIVFVVKSEPVRGSAVAAGLVNEPNYFAVKPVGEV